MRTFDEVPIPGTYRTSCCRHELTARRHSRLPVCPVCRKQASWALVQASELRPALPRDRKRDFRPPPEQP